MKYMQIEFAHICDNVILANNGNLSILNIFNQINSLSFPAAHSRLTVVVGVTGEKGEYPLSIKIIQKSNSRVIAELPPTDMKVPDRPNQGRFFVPFSPLVIPEAGQYEIQISIKDGENKENEKLLNFEARITT